MKYESIAIERVGDVGVISLASPDTLNALTPRMLDEIADAFERVPQSGARAIVLTGQGRAFCSGANLAAGGLELGVQPGDPPDLGYLLEHHYNPMMDKLRDSPVPWVSAVRGVAAGAGCSIALAADLIVAASDAYFLQAFARVGLVPDAGATYLLMRAVGRVRAMEMMMLADKIPAEQALSWGLISRVVPEAELDAAAMALAQRLAKGPTQTLAMIRQQAWRAAEDDWANMLKLERVFQKRAGRTADAREGIAAFLQKRPANFQGR